MIMMEILMMIDDDDEYDMMMMMMMMLQAMKRRRTQRCPWQNLHGRDMRTSEDDHYDYGDDGLMIRGCDKFDDGLKNVQTWSLGFYSDKIVKVIKQQWWL